jgi:hypothetical protein
MSKFVEIKPLIYNEDIIALKKAMNTRDITGLESQILKHEGLTEHKIQCSAKRYFDGLNKEMELKNIGQVFFYQIDNGANNLTIGAKVRKWQEGTQAKMTDVCILVWNIKKQINRTWFIEFKRIATKKTIEGSNSASGLKTMLHFEKQKRMQERLRGMGYDVYLTNNMIFCERVIGEEIREFLK